MRAIIAVPGAGRDARRASRCRKMVRRRTLPRARPSSARKDTDMSRVTAAPVEGASKLFTAEFNDYLCALHDALDGRARQLRAAREMLLKRALDGQPVTHLPASEATTSAWQVPP